MFVCVSVGSSWREKGVSRRVREGERERGGGMNECTCTRVWVHSESKLLLCVQGGGGGGGGMNECTCTKVWVSKLLLCVHVMVHNNNVFVIHRSVTDSVYGSAAAKKASIRRFTIDTTVPNWTSVAIIDQYGKKTPPPGPKRLADLQTRLELEGPSVNIHFKIAPNPFADGKESLVYHGYDYTNGRRVVFKQFKMASADFNRLDCYMKELEICTVAAAYASEFNSHKQRPDRCLPLEFVPLDVVQCQGGGDCYLLENFVSGKIVKFSNNAGVVSNTSPDTEVLQAFSHFTYVRSGKTLLVCDLQGVQEGYRFLLTDPAIHSRTTGSCYGSMDRGYDGIKRFFKTHVCSSICRSMELEQQ